MSLGEDLLVILSGYSRGYRLMRARMHGYTGPALPRSARKRLQETSENVLRVTLSRLKQRGLVVNEQGTWRVTKEGRALLDAVMEKLRRHDALRIHRGKPKTMIIAFDVPEPEKRAREWLRRGLKEHGFIMLQRSVWFGPAPLPKDFVTRLGRAELLQYMKFFKAEAYDIV